MLHAFLLIVGVYATLWYLYENLKSPIRIVVSLLTPCFTATERKSLKERYGEWAVVTGATDGIGRQYAKELARHGLNIVLISRTESKLVEVAKEIESTYAVKTKHIAVDFGDGFAIYERIKRELQSLDIGVLVNNVGTFHEFPDYVDHVAEDVLWKIMNINVGAVTMMSRMIIPHMKNKRRGVIVNVSSGSENQPMALVAIYSSSKIYNKFFTLALRRELKEFNVEVQLLSPMFVRTKINNYSETLSAEDSFVSTSVETYTRQAVFTLGKTPQTTGYWSHGLQVAITKLVPQSFRTQVAFLSGKFFRKEYLKNQKSM